jgi:acetyl-CoA acetyltransferase
VFVPDSNVIGEVDGGWRVAKSTLDNERVAMSSGSSFGGGVEALLAAVAEAGRDTDALVADRLGGLVADGQSLSLLAFRSTLRTLSGVEPGLAHVPGLAVQRHCATGLQAVNSVAADIRAGMTRVAIAGGAENMTQTPAVSMRSPQPWGGEQPWISLTHPDSEEAPAMVMGIAVGENTAEECGITREESDHWAYHSHVRAVAAIDEGRFADEIVPVEVPSGPRGETSVFDTDEHASNNGLEPLAVIRSWASVGVEPRRTGSRRPSRSPRRSSSPG